MNGIIGLLKVNPLPVLTIFETLIEVVPVFVRIMGSTICVPTVTVPKLRLVGFTDSAGRAVPVPERATSRVALLAVLFMASWPE